MKVSRPGLDFRVVLVLFPRCLWRRLVAVRVSLGGRDAGEQGLDGVSGESGRARSSPGRTPLTGCVSGLGFGQGVVDPRAKRRFWD
jgi:hypothetical protein